MGYIKRSNKVQTGSPAQRKALIQDVGDLLPSDADIERIDREVFTSCGVGQANLVKLWKDQIHGRLGKADTHSKMKVAQDWLTTAFMHPELRRAFLRKAFEDPIAVAKLVVAMMPKELNVEVSQQQGVVLVPMRMESIDDWEKKVLSGELMGDLSEKPRVGSWDDIVAEGGDGSGDDGDSGVSDTDGTGGAVVR